MVTTPAKGVAKPMVNGSKEEQGTATPSSSGASGLPLFFNKPSALDKVRHAKAGVLTQPNHSFAANTNSIMVNALEFIEAGKFYPLVFTAGENATAMAVLGLEKTNYMVDDAGKWQEDTYVPAYVRQYPFVFFEDEKQQRFFLCIDEESPYFRANGGEGTAPLFNGDGTPSPLSSQALEFCNSYYQHHTITRNFVKDLQAHNLLAPYQSSFKLANGNTLTLGGFHMIDETAFNALSDEVFLDFRKKGWIPFVHLALASASNWRRLAALAEKHMAAKK